MAEKEQRQEGTMVPDIEVGMHPSENAFVPGGCETDCF